jgi:hypothetical protein
VEDLNQLETLLQKERLPNGIRFFREEKSLKVCKIGLSSVTQCPEVMFSLHVQESMTFSLSVDGTRVSSDFVKHIALNKIQNCSVVLNIMSFLKAKST